MQVYSYDLYIYMRERNKATSLQIIQILNPISIPPSAHLSKFGQWFLQDHQRQEATLVSYEGDGDGVNEKAASNNEPTTELDVDNFMETNGDSWTCGQIWT